MSKLEKLIQELCPNGVKYKKLKDVSIMKRGTSLTKKNATFGNYPVISGGREPAFYCNKFNREGETISIAGSGAGAGYVQYWAEPIFVCDAFSVKAQNDCSLKYIYYCLENIQDKIYATRTGCGIPHVYISNIENFTIPIPPIEVQCKIVRILDNFTELTAKLIEKLTAELVTRKKQYNYYRNTLLTFDENDANVEWKSFADIGTIERGNGLSKADFTETGCPCIHYGQIYTYYGTVAYKTRSFTSEKLAKNLKIVSKGDIIIAVTSENMDDVCKCVAWLGNENIVTGGHTAIFKHNQNPKFIAYWLQTKEFYSQKTKLAQGTKVIEVSPKKLEKVRIPLPSLPEQQHIVDILDRFDKLCNDISQRLPAEIEARKKQYEYYRDKLLTFKERTA